VRRGHAAERYAERHHRPNVVAFRESRPETAMGSEGPKEGVAVPGSSTWMDCDCRPRLGCLIGIIERSRRAVTGLYNGLVADLPLLQRAENVTPNFRIARYFRS
jgi:hypothetical protein